MSLWKENNEDLKKRTGAKDEIKKSGVYDCVIEKAYVYNAKESQATAVCLNISTDTGYKRVSIWFRNRKGEALEVGQGLLNRLLYLAKTKVSKITIERKTEKTKDGVEIVREYIKELENFKVGIILEIKKEGKEEIVNVKDFYNIELRKTVDEIFNNTEAKTIEAFEKKYSNSKEVEAEKEEESKEEFPF